ncbi:MAG: hypothetical protein RMN24_08775 [Anaerolineae bacterium]|nr:hypothetical protein [Anaerolineae bacterium]
MTFSWSRVVAGVLVSLVLSVLIIGFVIALVMVLSPVDSIAAVQDLPRFAFFAGLITALACAWGAFVALRRLPGGHNRHGLLIGLIVGLVQFVLTPGDLVIHLLTLVMALAAGLFGARLAAR